MAPLFQDLLLLILVQRPSQFRFPILGGLRPEIFPELSDHVVLLYDT